MTENTALRVPKIASHGRFDGEEVVTAYHTPTATVFRYLHGGRAFPIYDADWTEFAPRLDFSDLHYAPKFTSLWD